MLETKPCEETLHTLMGEKCYKAWSDIISFIDKNYDYEGLYNKGGKKGVYELKYRKNGRPLCALYPRQNGLCILIIFGKAECEKFEALRTSFSEYISYTYDNTHQYHDGRWVYFDIEDDKLNDQIKTLIMLKKKPNKKLA